MHRKVEVGIIVSEIRERTDTQANTLIAILRSPSKGGVIAKADSFISWALLRICNNIVLSINSATLNKK